MWWSMNGRPVYQLVDWSTACWVTFKKAIFANFKFKKGLKVSRRTLPGQICASLRKSARVCAKLREFARICASLRESARVCANLREFGLVWFGLASS